MTQHPPCPSTGNEDGESTCPLTGDCSRAGQKAPEVVSGEGPGGPTAGGVSLNDSGGRAPNPYLGVMTQEMVSGKQKT